MAECNCGKQYDQYSNECNNCLQGEFTYDESCPSCDGVLLQNKLGEKWCSSTQCKYGME